MKNYTFKYALMQTLYWGIYLGSISYGSVYLLNNGFSNSSIGTILAALNILAMILQPMMGSFADSHPEIKAKTIMLFITCMTAILSLGLIFLSGKSLLLLVVYVSSASLFMVILPLLNALAFSLSDKYNINFGVARACGSLGYTICSSVLGYGIEWFGVKILPVSYFILNLLFILVVLRFEGEPSTKKAEVKQLSFIDFIKKYKRFVFLNAGVLLIFFMHTVINSFTIQIIHDIGGTESNMGIAVAIASGIEIPVMASFNLLKKKIRCSSLLKFSAIMYFIKHLVAYLSTNMFMFYFSQFLQIGAYAIFMVTVIYYGTLVVEKEDINKGQSLITASTTAGAVLATFVSGFLMDLYGVRFVMLIGVIATFIGSAIILFAAEKV